MSVEGRNLILKMNNVGAFVLKYYACGRTFYSGLNPLPLHTLGSPKTRIKCAPNEAESDALFAFSSLGLKGGDAVTMKEQDDRSRSESDDPLDLGDALNSGSCVLPCACALPPLRELHGNSFKGHRIFCCSS